MSLGGGGGGEIPKGKGGGGGVGRARSIGIWPRGGEITRGRNPWDTGKIYLFTNFK